MFQFVWGWFLFLFWFCVVWGVGVACFVLLQAYTISSASVVSELHVPARLLFYLVIYYVPVFSLESP